MQLFIQQIGADNVLFQLLRVGKTYKDLCGFDSSAGQDLAIPELYVAQGKLHLV